MGECRIHGFDDGDESGREGQEPEDNFSEEARLLDLDLVHQTGLRERLVKHYMDKYGWDRAEAERRVSEWDSRNRGLP